MHQGCFVWTPTPPLSGRRTPRPGPVRVCVCVLSWPGRAGRPPGRVLVRLTVSCGHFLLLSLSARPPLGWGCPACVFSGFFSPLVRCPCLRRSVFSGPGCLGPWRLLVLPPPLFWFFFLFLPPPPACLVVRFVFFFRGFFFLPLFSSCCAGCAVPGWCAVVCRACWFVLLWALCFGGSLCALALCCSVPLACGLPLCVVACCVVCARSCRAGGVALPLAALWCCPPDPSE